MSSIFGDSQIYETDLFNENIKDDNIRENIEQIENDDVDKQNSDNDNPDGDGEKNEVPQPVEPKRRIRRNLNINLNVDMLTGKRGVHTIENYYKDIKFKGKCHEKEDLNNIMKRLEHWSHRLFPRYTFDDNLASIENIGKKKILQTHMIKYRQNMLCDQDTNKDSGGEDSDKEQPQEHFDEMDELLDRQIAISRLDQTRSSLNVSRDLEFDNLLNTSFPGPSTSFSSNYRIFDPSISTSTEKTTEPPKQLSAELMAKIAENRMKAQQILNAKRLQNTSLNSAL